MSLTLQYATRCSECGLRMAVGEEYLPSTTSDGKWLITHPECPERKSRAQNLQPSFDVETLFHVRRCSGTCKNVVTYRKGRAPSSCSICQGQWDLLWEAA